MGLLQDIVVSAKFLTIVPLPEPEGEVNWRNVVAFFPVVGLFVGGLLYLCSFFSALFPYLALLLWVIISGGFHLDGLADSFDALAAGKSKEERLSIMKDSRIGNFGAVAVALLLIMKFNLINSLTFKALIVLPPVWGRAMLVLIPFAFDSAKKDGLGFFVKENTGERELAVSLFVSVLSTLLITKSPAFTLFLSAFTVVFGLLWGLLWKGKIGGFTGDVLGAACEICEALVLASFLMWRL
ncbi:MAG: adenosylcobinamide-GDP ribazoletransferase [Deferribacteres bacterium]|nr:adenosylcobinamide-GDP ribazoletransferase [Deferribacteres bacterium]